MPEHLNQSLVVSDVGFGPVSAEGKPQWLDSQMPFDPIRCFVVTKSLGCNTSITGVLGVYP